MDLRKAGKRKREESDVNIIPVMNIFLLLIPFLLLTAAFVKIAILDLSLPSLSKSGAAKQQQENRKKLTLVILKVKDNGFQLKSFGFKFDPIPKIQEKYNFQILANQLLEIKTKNTAAEDVIVAPDADTKYGLIIKIMDQCRESGFPNVTIGG